MLRTALDLWGGSLGGGISRDFCVRPISSNVGGFHFGFAVVLFPVVVVDTALGSGTELESVFCFFAGGGSVKTGR